MKDGTDSLPIESGCEVLVDEVLTERAYGPNRHIGVGPDGAVHVFFWDSESLIASRRAPGGGWSEQVLQGQSLDSVDFPVFRVAAGGRPTPSLLMAGSHQTTLWQLRDGVWVRRFSESSHGEGSELPIAVSAQGDVLFALGSASADAAQQLYVLRAGEEAPRLELTLSGVHPLLAVDREGRRHVLHREADSPRWLHRGPEGLVEQAFLAEHARPGFAVAGTRLAALYRDDEGITQLATRGAAGWRSAALGSEFGEECGAAWGDRPTEGQTCQHRSHRYAAWALAGGPRLALVVFERDQQGQRVADCSKPELGCVWVDGADFVDDSRLLFGTVGATGVHLEELPVHVPRVTSPSWRLALDQDNEGTLHMLLPAEREWDLGPLRYVRVRCDDT